MKIAEYIELVKQAERGNPPKNYQQQYTKPKPPLVLLQNGQLSEPLEQVTTEPYKPYYSTDQGSSISESQPDWMRAYTTTDPETGMVYPNSDDSKPIDNKKLNIKEKDPSFIETPKYKSEAKQLKIVEAPETRTSLTSKIMSHVSPWYLLPGVAEFPVAINKAQKNGARVANRLNKMGLPPQVAVPLEASLTLNDTLNLTALRTLVNHSPYSIPFMAATASPWNMGMRSMIVSGAASGIDAAAETAPNFETTTVTDKDGNIKTEYIEDPNSLYGYKSKRPNTAEMFPIFYYPSFENTSTRFLDENNNWDFSPENLKRIRRVYNNAVPDIVGSYIDAPLWFLDKLHNPDTVIPRTINAVKKAPGDFWPEVSKSPDMPVRETWYYKLPRDSEGMVDYPRIYKGVDNVARSAVKPGLGVLGKYKNILEMIPSTQTGLLPPNPTINMLLNLGGKPESYSVINTGRTADMIKHRKEIVSGLTSLANKNGFHKNIVNNIIAKYYANEPESGDDLYLLAANPKQLMMMYNQWRPSQEGNKEANPMWDRLVKYHPYLKRRDELEKLVNTGGELPKLKTKEEIQKDIFNLKMSIISNNSNKTGRNYVIAPKSKKVIRKGASDFDKAYYDENLVYPEKELGTTQNEIRHNLLQLEPAEMLSYMPYYKQVYGDDAYNEVMDLAFPANYRDFADAAVKEYTPEHLSYPFADDFDSIFRPIRVPEKIQQAIGQEHIKKKLSNHMKKLKDTAKKIDFGFESDKIHKVNLQNKYDNYISIGIPKEDAQKIIGVLDAIDNDLPLTKEQEAFCDNINLFGNLINTNTPYHGFEQDIQDALARQKKRLSGQE